MRRMTLRFRSCMAAGRRDPPCQDSDLASLSSTRPRASRWMAAS
jgi:hypothetical protein